MQAQEPGAQDLPQEEEIPLGYRVVEQGGAENCGLADSAKDQSCCSAPGLPAISGLSDKRNVNPHQLIS